MRRPLFSLAVISLILGLVAVSFFGQPVNPDDTARTEFLVTPGQNVDQIAAALSSARLIRSRSVFKLTVFRLNIAKKIQAGYFFLSPSQTVVEIARSLTRAGAKQVWVTIPEGLRREEVANLVTDNLVGSQTKHRFDADEFIRLTAKLEGRLFPDTYALGENITTGAVIEKMTKRFDEIVAGLDAAPEELNGIVILASLVEREAGDDAERPEIAAVLAKRLANNWPLQVDATIQYALSSARCRLRVCDWWPKSLTPADLKINSLYNTYTRPGLPVGPIGNPGRASLAASAKPKETPYWFYLHDPAGKIHLAKTIEEHDRNICTYLQKNC